MHLIIAALFNRNVRRCLKSVFRNLYRGLHFYSPEVKEIECRVYSFTICYFLSISLEADF